ncbi:MAG TPA: maleylpyruvate isomerase N-terminal domain-containing protein [Streptosporangiaceae bacterium]|nr:maleylpyruvate isomerase N-terminal domain-containing protein [Streptosporangiaceae bacterium]
MPTDPLDRDLPRLYRDARVRVGSLVSAVDDANLDARVPACPAWSVRDVVAHLAAVADDAVAGRLTGPPSEAETAAQVARFAGQPVSDVLARWAAIAPEFERLVGEFRVRAAVIDIASHEHDIRGALGRPGARDAEVVWRSAEWLLTGLQPPVPLRVVVEDAQFRLGPGSGTALRLTTSRFEAFRWRMGRRSRAQLAALDWSDDPAPVIDHLVVFGPAAHDVVE